MIKLKKEPPYYTAIPGNTIAPPRVYNRYIVGLYQSGTTNPTAFEYDNSLEQSPIMTRIGVGEYKMTFTGNIIEEHKLWMQIQAMTINAARVGIIRLNDNEIKIDTRNVSNFLIDGILDNTGLEIRIY